MLRRVFSALVVATASCMSTVAAEPMSIGSRLELFVDDHLVEELSGSATLELNRPTRRNVAIAHDEPWEGNACLYHTVFQDGDLYRMYYRGSNFIVGDTSLKTTHSYVCYAESQDGIHWTKPKLELVEFEGSKDNNIIWDGVGNHNFTPFKDANPDCKPAARYKAIGGGIREGGLFVFQSADGIHWSLMSEKPVITEGAFDSQNLAFWDQTRGEYREYHRAGRNGRDVMTCTSKDFLNWTEPQWLEYEPGRLTQLYTNQIIPYFRAPHIFLGFPARYITGRPLLNPLNKRIAQISKRFGTDYTDTGLITSRDAHKFHVWPEAFIRPGIQTGNRWVYGAKYTAWGILETASHLANAPDELSFYTSDEGYWQDHVVIRRYTLRQDGFVSVRAPLSGGELVTKPLTFDGAELVINYATSAAGSLHVEIQDAEGKPLDGFTLAESNVIFGDQLERVVSWKGGSDLSKLAGQPVRLRFLLKDADLYSIRFR